MWDKPIILFVIIIDLLMSLYQILDSFRQKQLTPKDISLLTNKMKEYKLNQIPLWKASTFTRLTTSTARLQGYLVIIAGLLFIPAAIYDKYQEDPSKIYRLAVYTPIATMFVLAPMYLYRRSLKRMLTTIQYNVPEKAFEITTFRNETFKIPTQQVQVLYNPQKPKIVHQIAVNLPNSQRNLYKIQGYGDWQSSEVFRFIIENKGIPPEPL